MVLWLSFLTTCFFNPGSNPWLSSLPHLGLDVVRVINIPTYAFYSLRSIFLSFEVLTGLLRNNGPSYFPFVEGFFRTITAELTRRPVHFLWVVNHRPQQRETCHSQTLTVTHLFFIYNLSILCKVWAALPPNIPHAFLT